MNITASNTLELLTPEEFRKVFKISKSTEWRWQNERITNPLLIHGLKRYRKSDAELLIVQNQKGS